MAKPTPTFKIVGNMPEVLRRSLFDSIIGFVVGTLVELVGENRFRVYIDHLPGKPQYLIEVTEGELPPRGTRILLSGKKGVESSVIEERDTQ